MNTFKSLAACTGLFCSAAAHAQAPGSVAIYGVLDEYAGHTSAQGARTANTLDSGGWQASRLGFRGREDLGGGLAANFVLEQGLSVDTGATADATRAFNRQAWLGLSGKLGEVRFGRQNTPQFFMCGNFDAMQCATYGSILNNASSYTPRFDNTLHYLSPDFAGLKLQGGVSLSEQATGSQKGQSAYIAAAEYQRGPLYLGANHVRQYSADTRFSARATFVGGNYEYGKGKVYVGWFQGTTPGAAVATNVPGRAYKIWSLSGNYLIGGLYEVGALYGRANDTSSANHDASQVAVIGRYLLSKRTMIYTVATKLRNDNGANFSLGAAAPITRNTPAPGGDVSGVQLGVRHLF